MAQYEQTPMTAWDYDPGKISTTLQFLMQHKAQARQGDRQLTMQDRDSRTRAAQALAVVQALHTAGQNYKDVSLSNRYQAEKTDLQSKLADYSDYLTLIEANDDELYDFSNQVRVGTDNTGQEFYLDRVPDSAIEIGKNSYTISADPARNSAVIRNLDGQFVGEVSYDPYARLPKISSSVQEIKTTPGLSIYLLRTGLSSLKNMWGTQKRDIDQQLYNLESDTSTLGAESADEAYRNLTGFIKTFKSLMGGN